ncbi:hypothetical protein HYPSUDRAFT_34827 [Hypholoma sublateritium FD-334 SS-4]|uniref:Uncharacterized protein n=1 Tax=Hypholoma sublateritium (strain FD-334 SS-4) TaxID=945553 RepID=A0A0D2PGT3_HYPSF|nr:hypothetical protein HYPSUDRAFT_34827 [Hypholoma sublateritium FD-334 SS-4]
MVTVEIPERSSFNLNPSSHRNHALPRLLSPHTTLPHLPIRLNRTPYNMSNTPATSKTTPEEEQCLIFLSGEQRGQLLQCMVAAEISSEAALHSWPEEFNLGAPMPGDAEMVQGELLLTWDTMADGSFDEVALAPSGSEDVLSADEEQAIPWPANEDEMHDLFTDYMAEESENS